MFNLISPGKPELRPSMNKEKQRFVDVSGLHIMDLYSIDIHVLVFSILGIQQTGWRSGSGLDVEQSPSNLEQSDDVTNEEGGDGDEETDEDRDDPEPLNHLFTYFHKNMLTQSVLSIVYMFTVTLICKYSK